jgi:glycosyltransferase involved in cell wall biosynthesis
MSDQSTSESLKLVLAHPHPAPHVMQAALAFYERDALKRYVTGLINDESSRVQNLFCKFARLTGYDLRRQLRRRSLTNIPVEITQQYPLGETMRTVVSKFDRDKRLTDRVFHWATRRFDQMAATRGLTGMNAVYAYEYTCRQTLPAAKARGISTIYEVPSPQHDFVYDILHPEFEKFPELITPYYTYCRERQAERTQHRKEEFEAADIIISNSRFTRDSFESKGWDAEKIHVVPLGAPPPIDEADVATPNPEKPLQALWAGTFSIRKGAHYLLDAWKEWNPGKRARLVIHGAIDLPAQLMADLPDSIEVHGSIPRDELYAVYQESDLLMFPTLCDGFGMVTTEGFSKGLPVLTTRNAGSSDLVRHQENGLLIEPADAAALAESLEWAATHRNDLHAMRYEALKTASGWQWEDYRELLYNTIINSIN